MKFIVVCFSVFFSVAVQAHACDLNSPLPSGAGTLSDAIQNMAYSRLGLPFPSTPADFEEVVAPAGGFRNGMANVMLYFANGSSAQISVTYSPSCRLVDVHAGNVL